jgi:hypothetical protein
MQWILERLEHKCAPQGLNVMVEELHWMGVGSATYKKLWRAVRTELRSKHPRIRPVAEAVYWFADRNLPQGWSLFRERSMLPCFYRLYPPAISWEELDQPGNILPRPARPRR